MSRPSIMVLKCFMCGEKSEQMSLGSSNAIGWGDLDFRPPEMLRGTMRWWIQECPHCGYASDQIDDETDATMNFLLSEGYKNSDGIVFLSNLAKKFYKFYLISKVDDNQEDAFKCMHRAAWACDDKGDTDNAVICRKKALEELDNLIQAQDSDKLQLIRADLLRRTRQYNKVIEEYSDTVFEENNIKNEMIKFQLQKAKEQDDKCYSIAHAMNPNED